MNNLSQRCAREGVWSESPVSVEGRRRWSSPHCSAPPDVDWQSSASASRDLEDLESDLRFFYYSLNSKAESDEDVFSLPAIENDPYSGTSPHAELLERRALALWRLAAGAGSIVVFTARSLLGRLVGRADQSGPVSSSTLAKNCRSTI